MRSLICCSTQITDVDSKFVTTGAVVLDPRLRCGDLAAVWVLWMDETAEVVFRISHCVDSPRRHSQATEKAECAPPTTQRDGGAAAAALVRDALSDSFGEENVTDCEPADGDEQEYICLMKVVLDEQSATCGLVREGSELRADVASDDDALRRRLRKLLERTLSVCVPIPTSSGG